MPRVELDLRGLAPGKAPGRDGVAGVADAGSVVVRGPVPALAGVLTALLHVLLLGTPRPFTFFAWITGLADVVAAAAPFTQPAPLASKIFTAIINIAVGVAVISLLSGVGRVAIRPVVPPTVTVTGVGRGERPASR